MANATASAAILFGGVTPVLRVSDVVASRDYYVRALGFKVNFETEDFVSVSRGRCGLFLCQGDQGHAGSWVWVDGKDVDALMRNTRHRAQRSAILPRTIPGHWRCRSKTPTATSCDSGRTPVPANPMVNGSICTVADGKAGTRSNRAFHKYPGTVTESGIECINERMFFAYGLPGFALPCKLKRAATEELCAAEIY